MTTRPLGETIKEVAPRLARAYEAERAYQERRASYSGRGFVPIDVAIEEMIRGVRLWTRTTGRQWSGFRRSPEVE